jgi:hypothetical protein
VLPRGVAQKNAVITRYKTKGRDWGLSPNEAEELLLGNCHYCGVPPSNKASNKRSNGEFVYNGIDRIDNTLGYEAGNVVSCCKRCNIAKNDMPYDEFKNWVAAVYANLVRKEDCQHAAS